MIRLFNHYLSSRMLLLTFLEGAVLFHAVFLGIRLRFLDSTLSLPMTEAATFTFVMLVMMSALGLYQQDHAEPFSVIVQRLVVAYGLALTAIALIFYLFPATYIGRGVIAITSVFALAGVLFIRLIFFRWTRFGLPKRRVLVLGNGDEADKVIHYLTHGEQARSVRYAGLLPVFSDADRPDDPMAVRSALKQSIKDLGVNEIVIAARERRGGVLPLRELLDAKLHGIRVMDLSSFYEREFGQVRVDSLKASWLIFGDGFDQGLMRDVVKRTFDVVVSLMLLLLTLPVLLVTATIIVLESGFPVFYRQERVGEGGDSFMVLKLRSMRNDAEKDGKPRWASGNDDRVTRVGRFIRKTRIDELPQILNVLRGEMSFVGPRPERPFFVKQLIEQVPYYDVRHSVKPGVTGWSQVRFPYGASVEDAVQKLQYDLYYVKNHSLFLDLLILVETVQVVLWGKGAR